MYITQKKKKKKKKASGHVAAALGRSKYGPLFL